MLDSAIAATLVAAYAEMLSIGTAQGKWHTLRRAFRLF